MSDEWNATGSQEPARRTGMPRWVWFCGGGCVLMLLVGLLAAVLLGRLISESSDTDLQWERLEQVLPSDPERRPSGELVGGKIPLQPLRMWFLVDRSTGLQAMFLHVGGSKGEEVRRGFFRGHGNGARAGEALEAGQVEVQGRVLPVVRFIGEPDEDSGSDGGFMQEFAKSWTTHGSSASAVVDLSKPDSPDTLLLILNRIPFDEQDEEEVARPIEDEEVQRFLRPFHVGEQR